jgi:hypothetical protein
MSKHPKNKNRRATDERGTGWVRWGVVGVLAVVAAAAVAIAFRGDDATAEVTRTPLAEQVETIPADRPAGQVGTPDVDDLPEGTSVPGLVDNRPREVFVEGKNGLPDFTFRLPEPGDPDYEDYQEMLRHPEYARFNHDKTLPMYYDPEWRSHVNGRREVPVNDLVLAGGAVSVEELLTFVLFALGDEDADGVDQLRINRDEFQLLCWPEFPQSRPYLKIPPDEAWSFHFASMRKGAKKAFHEFAGKPLSLVSFDIGSVQEYTNFRILQDVTMTVLDADTGQEIQLDMVEAVLACRGKYKVFMYRE